MRFTPLESPLASWEWDCAADTIEQKCVPGDGHCPSQYSEGLVRSRALLVRAARYDSVSV